jgi:hypothetical protein
MAGRFKRDLLEETKKNLPGPGTYDPSTNLIKEKTKNIFLSQRYEDESKHNF